MQTSKHTLFILALLLIPAGAFAQEMTPEHHAVRATIDQLFDGMRAGDSTMVRQSFHPRATMATTGNRDGSPFLRGTSVEGFVTAVGTPHDQVWDEHIWDVDIQIDDNLAIAYVPYAFYLGDRLSHCGVNMVHFFQMAPRDWRIIYLADTRRPSCDDIPANKLEETNVRAAVRHYLRGHATGDGSHHERVFHPESKLNWMRDGELNQRSSADYIAGASGQPAADEAERQRYIAMVDLHGDAAIAKVVLDYPSVYIVDYFTLLKVDGRWQIMNKIFNVESR